MIEIPCFFVERSGVAVQSLRRFCSWNDYGSCPTQRGYHTTIVEIARGMPWRDEMACVRDSFPHDDPRWPKACACGYVYTVDDAWQNWHEELYVNRATGELHHLNHFAPVGAMRYCPPETMGGRLEPYEPYLVMTTPAGLWIIDGNDGMFPRFRHIGTPPRISVAEVHFRNDDGSYVRGDLRDGVLRLDCELRPTRGRTLAVAKR